MSLEEKSTMEPGYDAKAEQDFGDGQISEVTWTEAEESAVVWK